jgi:class 3 adenylate cyclase
MAKSVLESNIKNFNAYLDTKRDDIENVVHELWLSKDNTLWVKEPYFYIKLAETADKLGQAMFTRDILEEGLNHFPDNLRINQLYSLSLIKCGFLERAGKLLTNLVKRGNLDEETLGLLGRVYKDMWLISGESSYLMKSRNLYFKAFKKNKGYYSGINAASLSLMLKEKDNAYRMARVVLKICFDLLKDQENRDYWCLATVGEAYLVLEKQKEAEKYYALAKGHSEKNYSWLASTRKQIMLLGKYMDVSEGIQQTMRIPPVIAFTGHMLDRPERKSARFPKGIEQEVKKEILKRIEIHKAGIGYSSCACGSDILFLEAMQSRKAETNIVLPFEIDDFYETSVTYAGEEWKERMHDVLVKATSVLFATEGKYSGDDLLFEYANKIIMGKTILRSELLETEPVLIAVWDGKQKKLKGGTSEFVSTWELKSLPIEIIDINTLHKSGTEIVKEAGKKEASKSGGKQRKTRSVQRGVKALLFADLVGYSTLKEEQFPYYIDDYLNTLASNLRSLPYKPLFKNIWGDALYFVFDDLTSCAKYALELRDLIKNTDWEKKNLPADLNIRIGLHVGPVYYAKEPILQKTNYFGNHVNWAARIEPITNPGNVYASEQFASLLMAQKNSDLVCRYVGIIVLPKRFGKYPIYHVKKRDEIT